MLDNKFFYCESLIFCFYKANNKENKIESRIKAYFQILLLVFTITALTIILSADKLIQNIENETQNSNDYVSAFVENTVDKILNNSYEG